MALSFSRARMGFLLGCGQGLRTTSLLLMIAGAVVSVLSYFSGDAEADRLCGSMPPAAQQILASPNGASAFLSHALLGQYLMYAFSDSCALTRDTRVIGHP
jgi:hypothetical protein